MTSRAQRMEVDDEFIETFGYKTCEVYFTTHAAKGPAEDDLIMAAKTDALSAE